MPGDVEIPLGDLAVVLTLFVFVFVVIVFFVVFFVVFLFVIRRIVLGEFKDG
jgi:hypothetical protein